MGVTTIMREEGEKEGGDMKDIMKVLEISLKEGGEEIMKGVGEDIMKGVENSLKGEGEDIMKEEGEDIMRNIQCKCIGEADLWQWVDSLEKEEEEVN